MKNLLLVALIAIFQLKANGQIQSGFHYRITNGQIINYKSSTAATDVKKKICGNRLKAGVAQEGNVLKLDFWGIDAPTDPCAGNTLMVNSSDLLGSSFYYIEIQKRLDMSISTSFVSLTYVTWELGVSAIPFKYRFGNKKDSIPNDASANINGGIYIGRKWGATRFYEDKNKTTNSWAVTVGAIFSPTVISLSPENTQKKVATKSSEFGLSYGLALLTSYRDINIGILGGLESPLSGNAKDWIYTNRPWIGFGVGYKLGILGGK